VPQCPFGSFARAPHEHCRSQSASRHRARKASMRDAKGAGLDAGPSPLLRRRCLSAVGDPLFDPGLYFFGYPRDPTSAKRYPLGELASRFEPRDVRETVGDAIDRFEFLLRYQLPCHRKSLVKGTLQRPVSQLTGTEKHRAGYDTSQCAHSYPWPRILRSTPSALYEAGVAHLVQAVTVRPA